jgi:hypothetical protein|tara:strand:+ start:1877 stop:2920 length:1044 start_codon:yes stop_codon:yes gene_type:complete
MAEVYTSAGASIMYGLEAANAYGTPVTANKTFGLNSRVTSLSVTTNRIDFNKLGQREPTAFAYGQQQGRLGVGFVMDTRTSHEVFGSLYGEDANGSTPFEYPATLGEGQAVVEGRSLTTQIQLQTSQNTLSGSNKKVLITRKLIGCIVNSLGLSTSIGEPLNVSVDMTFGQEDTTNTTHATSGTSSQVDINASGRPFTFAHGTLSVWNGSAMQAVGEVQSVDVNFNQNAELLYKLGSHYATQSYRKVLDITGRFQTTFKDITLLQHLLEQASDSTNLTAKGGIAEDSSSPTVAAKLVFDNPQDTSKKLTIELTGLSFDEHSVTGLEPVEVVYQELPFKALAAKITQI